MKPHRILKDFKGTQTGFGDGEQFIAGTTTPLSDWLAEVAVSGGLAEPVEGIPVADGQVEEVAQVFVDNTPVDPENRETKVNGPTETKITKPLKKMSKAELVAHALDVYGLELAPDNLTANQMIEAIEEAAKKAAEDTAA